VRHAILLLAVLSRVLGAAPAGTAATPESIDHVRVYLHYHARSDRDLVDAIAGVLESMDYRVWDKRRVTQPSAGDVRFFHDGDETAAVHVKAIVENVLAGKGRDATLAVLDRRGRFEEARPGLVEVWVPPPR
jgi:hypothetical protein